MWFGHTQKKAFSKVAGLEGDSKEITVSVRNHLAFLHVHPPETATLGSPTSTDLLRSRRFWPKQPAETAAEAAETLAEAASSKRLNPNGVYWAIAHDPGGVLQGS